LGIGKNAYPKTHQYSALTEKKAARKPKAFLKVGLKNGFTFYEINK
jgi:hypothetical protein